VRAVFYAEAEKVVGRQRLVTCQLLDRDANWWVLACGERWESVSHRQPELGDDVLGSAPRMAVNKDATVVRLGNRERRLAILVRRAQRGVPVSGPAHLRQPCEHELNGALARGASPTHGTPHPD